MRTSIRLCCGFAIAVGVFFIGPLTSTATVILDLRFDQLNADAGGGTPTDGQAIRTGGDFSPANVFDHSGNLYTTQSIGTPLTYAVGLTSNGGSIPEAPDPLPDNFDSFAVRGTGRNYVRYPDNTANANLVNAFSGDFSAWTRIYREGASALNGQFHHIIGSAQKNNFGWCLYGLGLGSEESPSFRLEGFFGGELVGTEPEDPTDRFFSSNGPQLDDQEWFDIGVIFSGNAEEGDVDTVKVFLDGVKVLERTGVSDFGAAPLGQVFSYGMDTYGNNGFKGLTDRIILWDEAVDESVITDLSPPQVPILAGDYNNDAAVNAADYVVWRKSEGTSIVLPNDPLGGPIGSAQYDLWRANFGGTGGEGVTAGTVPEPTALVLTLLLIGTCFPCIRRRW